MSENVNTQFNSPGNVISGDPIRIDSTTVQVAASRPEAVDAQVNLGSNRSGGGIPGKDQLAKSSRSLDDVSLKFEIDAKTNDVTILILDKASQKVVRTIPPDEMTRLDPGELLQFFA